ncbi:MAG TPA: hypothetical protein VJT49_14730 [Amycolatopsis sp.]|uniref:hypothetical protein n=1 Tax=Amycolatopsis sp. TaxID=37632 RepID=UPI002B48B3FD|nr:hypothetical protein [Amycolatopsis sp.]HKS46333.1 hypothetical protein [Amycolatopsis sp.]
MTEIPEPTVRPTGYEVCCLPEDHPDAVFFAIEVEYRGDGRWTVVRNSRHLGVDGKWSYGYSWRDGSQEPQTDEEFREAREGQDAWYQAHRFDLDTALELAKQHAPHVTVNRYSVADVIEHGKARS